MDGLKIFKLLSNKTRLELLMLISSREMCICEMLPLVKKSQPNVSIHLKKLREAGAISSFKKGTKVFHKIKDPKIKKILDIIGK